jgi:hypothetical protein
MSVARVDESPYTLVVCEKPDAARRIAHALGNSSLKERSGSPPVFSVTDRRNERFVVCSAYVICYLAPFELTRKD